VSPRVFAARARTEAEAEAEAETPHHLLSFLSAFLFTPNTPAAFDMHHTTPHHTTFPLDRLPPTQPCYIHPTHAVAARHSLDLVPLPNQFKPFEESGGYRP
jgi:hypothetical protein